MKSLGMIHVFTPFGILVAGSACSLVLSFVEHLVQLLTPKRLLYPQDLQSDRNCKRSLERAQHAFLTMNQARRIILSKELSQDQEEQLRLLKNLLK